MNSPVTTRPVAATSPVLALLPIMGVVFAAYLLIGLAMPVLALYVHVQLAQSTFLVGVVAGSQFGAALLSRPWAGYFADSRGPKQAVVAGLVVAAGAGLCYLASLRVASQPTTAVAVLLVGRVLLGFAESFIITGALSLGLARLGTPRTGQVMSWVGTALYAAYAVGAPVGTTLYARYGFKAIALAATGIPLFTLLLVALLQGAAPRPAVRPALTSVLRAVWRPGVGAAISSVGFGAITTFIVLLYAQQYWGQSWLAFTLLSLAFVVGRLLLGHLPDKIGGAKVALGCVLVEALGLALIWRAGGPGLALAGVVLTGLSYSLVYPALGVEALRRAPPESRGLAMGAYTAFLDLSLGVASPALGLVAGGWGLSAVFLVSAVVVLGAAGVALQLLRDPAPVMG